MAESDVQPGRKYRHFKGGLYRVVCVATHSETEERLVVYEALPDRGFFVRPLTMFLDEVERGGYKGPRFVEIPEDNPD